MDAEFHCVESRGSIRVTRVLGGARAARAFAKIPQIADYVARGFIAELDS